MPQWINGDGPSNAKLMLVGEFPSRQDEEDNLPFVGPSGRLIDDMLQEAGLSRNEVYCTNVVKVRPPMGKLERLPETGHKLDEFIPILWNEINAIKPNAILVLGELALKVLTGKSGIVHYRGSVLQTVNGYPKVIPSIHPANLIEHRNEGMWHWKDKTYFQLDFNKAVRESTYQEFRLPSRNLWICKHSYDLLQFLLRHKNEEKLSIDIESYRSTPLCIGLSFTKSEAISIPLVDLLSDNNSSGVTLTEMTNIWKIILEVLSDERIKKIGQNFKFDERVLSNFGFNIRGFYSDIMLKFHVLYSEFPKRLEFQTSIFTDEPYYKAEGKEYNPKKDDLSRLLLYNAKDAAVTREIDEVLESELEERGLVDYFYNFYMKLHYLYINIEDNGICLDKTRHLEVVTKYRNKLQINDKILYELVGREFNIDSPAQVCDLLYNELKLPQRTERRANGKSSLTANENALMTLIANVKMSTEKKEIVTAIMKHRSIGKTLGTYLGVGKNE